MLQGIEARALPLLSLCSGALVPQPLKPAPQSLGPTSDSSPGSPQLEERPHSSREPTQPEMNGM